jgi:hypothetical protein
MPIQKKSNKMEKKKNKPKKKKKEVFTSIPLHSSQRLTADDLLWRLTYLLCIVAYGVCIYGYVQCTVHTTCNSGEDLFSSSVAIQYNAIINNA